MSSVVKVLSRIERCPARNATKLIAVDGRGGSGKSSLVRELQALRPTLKVVPVDSFPCTPEKYPWHPLGTQTRIDWERLRDEALLPLIRGENAVFVKTHWWPSQPPGPSETVTAGGTVVVEGCYSLLPALRGFYDLAIWVECPREEALEKAIQRDGEEIRTHWELAYCQNENAYIEAHNPSSFADIVLRNSGRDRFELLRG